MAMIDWEFYVDGNRYLGAGTMTLPNLEYQTVEKKGAGISGAIDVPVPGSNSKMEISITFNDVDKDNATVLCQEKFTSVSAYSVSHQMNRATGQYEQIQEIVEMDIYPKGLNLGTLNPGELRGVEQSFIAKMLKWTIDGKLKLHKDPINRINIVDGVDQNANIRSLLGL